MLQRKENTHNDALTKLSEIHKQNVTHVLLYFFVLGQRDQGTDARILLKLISNRV